MADLGPMRESVGIRQVTHDGVKLPPAMRLAVTGGTLTSETQADGVLAYALDLSSMDASAASILSLENRVAKLEALPTLLETHVAPVGYSTVVVEQGDVLPVDIGGRGSDEGVVVEIPAATTADAGREIQIFEVSEAPGLGKTSADIRLAIKVPDGQSIAGLNTATFTGGTLPPELDGISVVFMTGIGPSIVLKSLGDRWLVRARSF